VQKLRLHRVGNGLAHSVSKDFAGAEIYIVGASIARPFSTVSSALSGRDIAINVLVRSQSACGKNVSEKGLTTPEVSFILTVRF